MASEMEYSVLATLWEREAEEPTQVLGDSPIFVENEPCKAAGRLVTGSTVSWDGGTAVSPGEKLRVPQLVHPCLVTTLVLGRGHDLAPLTA